MDANKNAIHICSTLEEAQAESQARVQGLKSAAKDQDSLAKKLASIPVPLRSDGMQDLRAYETLALNFHDNTLGELISAVASGRFSGHEGILLEKAIEMKQIVTVNAIVDLFMEEELSVSDSIELTHLIMLKVCSSKVGFDFKSDGDEQLEEETENDLELEIGNEMCPRCENEEVQPDDNYCGICGLQLREV